MLTPFVKPRQVLSYLVLAIAPGRESKAQDFKRVSQQSFSIGHCNMVANLYTRFQVSYTDFLSVQLAQNGRKTIQSVKVGVHHRK